MDPAQNPFHMKGYQGVNLFCDRENETALLISNAENGVNTTLLSIRRMGKTGLIHHVFNRLKKNNELQCIYTDIYATQNLAEFTNQLASAIMVAFPQSGSIGKKFLNLIRGFSPLISYDPLTGSPAISFTYAQPKQYEHSLKSLFDFLERQNKPVLIALDEFQQIAGYPEKNTEALLRTIIQSLNKVNFIFSGSHKYLLTEMFSNAKRPFYSSTRPLYLSFIEREKYAAFIQKLFNARKRKITADAIQFILDWTRLHTYYTQALCNKIYALGNKNIKTDEVYHACDTLLKEQEVVFFQYRNLLTAPQWQLLKAIAKQDGVYQPMARQFIQTHRLGTPATVKRSLEALITKEMIYKEEKKNTGAYRVNDCFLSRWLERI